MPEPDDLVFKALADPTRRLLLDRLRRHDGQTLGELCEHLDMTRQSASQHLDVLVAANLVSTRREGRRKLHHLNPVPLHEVQRRWIDRFEQPRLRALHAIRTQAEETTMTTTTTDPATASDATRHTYVYVTYIEATADAVWHAITDADLSASYWGHRNESTWEPGAPWAHVRDDGSGIADIIGEVLESDRPRRLVTTWASADGDGTDRARLTMDLHEQDGLVRLTVTHEDLTADGLADVARGWPAILSNLKSLLETGSVLPVEPWSLDGA